MKRNLLLGSVILVICALRWLLDTPAPKPARTDKARAPAAPVEIDKITVPHDAAEANTAFAARLRAHLNRAGSRADEAVLTFADRDALNRFLARASAAGVAVLGQLDALNTVRVRVNDHAAFARELAAHSGDYTKVSGNLILTEPTPSSAEARAAGQAAPVGNNLLGLLGLDPDNPTRGRGVTIAILDGGAAPGATFGNRLTYLDIGYGITGYGDDARHATSVAALAGGLGSASGEASGVASAANLLSIKVSGSDGQADAFSVAAGVLAAIDAGAQVINISLGAYGDSPVLAEAIERAVAAGIAVVAAAGNDQAGQLAWPAAYPGVVSVGATDANGQQAIFSNSGDTLQLTAPGYGIITTGPGDTRVSFSGTSASAPIVAGSIAALLSADPELTPLAAADLLATYGNDSGVAGPDRDYGRATINPGWALDRDNPDRIDVAITSFGYNPTAQTVTVVVQNRGNRPLSGLTLTITIGNHASVHPLPLLDSTASSTTTVAIPANTEWVDSRTLLVIDLQPPAGVTDQDPSNNRRAAILNR
ncbi:MAG: S8 family serine peptidase [Verrucomicrobiota bacterium]